METPSNLALHAGEAVEANGFAAIRDENVRLEFAELRAGASGAPLTPKPVVWEDASSGVETHSLVSMEGQVVAAVQDDQVDELILQAEAHLFSATLRKSSSDSTLEPLFASAPVVGSRVRITGVCFADSGRHGRDRLRFDLRMRSPADVSVLKQPSWWTVKRLAYIVTAMSMAILIAVIWLGMLDKRLRDQTAIVARQSQEEAIRDRHLAKLEQQRSQILERISSSAQLPEVLRDIRSMVSSRLFGASCWFELHSVEGAGGSLGTPAGDGLLSQELFSRSGNSLGFLVAAPLLRGSAEVDAMATLSVGARLAELAIETRRLYSDLRHRSEYDLLTDIPNRFSMERQLDQIMLQSVRKDSMFGLIYIDLDRFKQINDQHGHRIGDLYLQQATQRMKMQMRNGDTLARIGGDEFMALAPVLHSRADAEEIAMRLEHCFDDPFTLEGITFYGSASIGLAVYPEDGLNKEELQRWADSAMYAHKQEKRQRDSYLEGIGRAAGSVHLD